MKRPPPTGAPSGAAIDDFAADLDRMFSAAGRVEDVAFPVSRTLPSRWKRVVVVPPADPGTLICVLGPCRHYTSHVRYLPTANESPSSGNGVALGAGDGIARTIREHRCRLLNEDMQDEYVFACSSWRPSWWPRLVLWLRRQRPGNVVQHATPDDLAPPEGIGPCRGCHRSLERCGLVDAAARRALNSNLDAWCWCGHRERKPTTWEEALGS